MARFRKIRAKARTFFKRKSYSKSSGQGMTAEKIAIGSVAYGAVRPYAANLIPDVAMLGAYSDNVMLGTIGYVASKKGSGMIKTAGMIVLANEAFLVGNKLASGLSPNGNNTGYVYG